jgi:hypothetical protein
MNRPWLLISIIMDCHTNPETHIYSMESRGTCLEHAHDCASSQPTMCHNRALHQSIHVRMNDPKTIPVRDIHDAWPTRPLSLHRSMFDMQTGVTVTSMSIQTLQQSK